MHELTNVECKGPGKLSDNPLFGRVVRAVIGMANRPGGGIVIVGISERNHVLCPEGLTDEQMATWRYEDIADGINKHADPPISFGYQPCEWGGKKFLILHIHEFTDVPIICKKEYRDDSNQQLPLEKREKVLKKGFLYARSPNKPETKEIDSVESMRTVLNPAIDKGIGRFVKQLQIASIPSEEKKQEERKLRLQALLADHRGFLDDRLDSFVGREAELAQIRPTTLFPSILVLIIKWACYAISWLASFSDIT